MSTTAAAGTPRSGLRFELLHHCFELFETVLRPTDSQKFSCLIFIDKLPLESDSPVSHPLASRVDDFLFEGALGLLAEVPFYPHTPIFF